MSTSAELSCPLNKEINLGTSATVRLIQCLLNTGFTVSQTQGLLTGLPVASPVYKTHSFSSLGEGGYF